MKDDMKLKAKVNIEIRELGYIYICIYKKYMKECAKVNALLC